MSDETQTVLPYCLLIIIILASQIKNVTSSAKTSLVLSPLFPRSAQPIFRIWISSIHLDSRCYTPMGLLPNTSNYWCACAGNTGNVFPATAVKQSRHASRHVRDARAVMHAGIANSRFPLNSAAGENVPGIPGACVTRNFTYLVWGPCHNVSHDLDYAMLKG